MDCYGSQEKMIRGCFDDSKLGLSWDHNFKTDMIPQNEMLSLMEHHVENFDAGDEEEDLKNLVGKEELIINVMKSLEMEIAVPKIFQLEEAAGATNSCCLQSDSAVSMCTSSSSFSDPCQLNLGTECRCHGQAEDGDSLLGLLLSNEMHHGLFQTSEFYESETEGIDLLQSLSRIGSCSSMKELLDLDILELEVWE